MQLNTKKEISDWTIYPPPPPFRYSLMPSDLESVQHDQKIVILKIKNNNVIRKKKKEQEKKKKVFSPFQDSIKTSIKMELPPLKWYKFRWGIILRWPCGLAGTTVQLLTTCGANLCPILFCNAQWKKRGVLGWGWGWGEWWTETGKINMDVVSSRVLMSTTQGHVRKKYKVNGQKEKIKREKDVKY